MSALGDIVHALPVLSAIRAARPEIEVDWLADKKYAGILDYTEGIAKRIIGRPGLSKAVTAMRARAYDVAIDLQGLIKSAAMARLSGATRIIGFEQAALREPAAAWFYSESAAVPAGAHIIQKNFAILPLLDISPPSHVTFPFVLPASAVADGLEQEAASRGAQGFALINPGAAWPNKRWAPDRFAAVARQLRARHGLVSFVLWGLDEAPLADAIVADADGAAARAPQTSLGDLMAVSARARLMVSGDTGPLHIAAAVGTPLVGLYGPTWPERNGPWDADDIVVSRAATCECHHKRQCRRSGTMCINEIAVEEVVDAASRRLARAAAR